MQLTVPTPIELGQFFSLADHAVPHPSDAAFFRLAKQLAPKIELLLKEKDAEIERLKRTTRKDK